MNWIYFVFILCTFSGSVTHLKFKAAFNNHSIASQVNRTPLRLSTLYKHLLLLNYPEAATEEVDSASTPHALITFCPLNRQELKELSVAVNPLENDGNKGKTLYCRVQEFIYHKIVNI